MHFLLIILNHPIDPICSLLFCVFTSLTLTRFPTWSHLPSLHDMDSSTGLQMGPSGVWETFQGMMSAPNFFWKKFSCICPSHCTIIVLVGKNFLRTPLLYSFCCWDCSGWLSVFTWHWWSSLLSSCHPCTLCFSHCDPLLMTILASDKHDSITASVRGTTWLLKGQPHARPFCNCSWLQAQ